MHIFIYLLTIIRIMAVETFYQGIDHLCELYRMDKTCQFSCMENDFIDSTIL